MVCKENNSILMSTCSSYFLLGIIASRWTVMVLHALQQDVRRYSDITRAIPGITQKVLTDTLRKLERNGIVERTVYPVVPPKVEYRLTSLGKSLFETTEMMAKWAEANGDAVMKSRDKYDNQINRAHE